MNNGTTDNKHTDVIQGMTPHTVSPRVHTSSSSLGISVHRWQGSHVSNFLIFSTTWVWNISQSKKNWARYIHICTYIFMISTRYFCQILMKLKLSWQIFEKLSDFMKICSVGVDLFHAGGWMDRQTLQS